MNIEKYQKRRKELCLTYDQIAERAGISKSTVAGFFSGNERYTNPSIATLQAIEKALNISNEVHFDTPKKDYPDIMAALNNGGDLLTQDDIKDIVLFIEFKKSNK